MERTIVVTDLTWRGTGKICLAGYFNGGYWPHDCVRPMLLDGKDLTQEMLFTSNGVVRPFSRVSLGLERQRSRPPHSEDWTLRTAFELAEEEITEDQKWKLLSQTKDGSVESVFGGRLFNTPNAMHPVGEGTRSLGTVYASEIIAVNLIDVDDRKRVKCYLGFCDETGSVFSLPVNDLALCLCLWHMHKYLHISQNERTLRLLKALRSCDQIALRLGLGREWNGVHYVQINGIYTEPDYLNGRCFADFVMRTTEPRRTQVEIPF